MNMKNVLFVAFIFLTCVSFGQNWMLIKDVTSPINELEPEFDSMYRQPLSTVGWEDGLHISNDGLNLYCTYLPIDFLSFLLTVIYPIIFNLTI